jgi:hypothetical protein
VARFAVQFLTGGGTPVCEAYTGWLRRGAEDATFILDLGEKNVGFEDEWTLLGNVEAFLWTRDVNPANQFRIDEMPQWKGTPDQLAAAREDFHRRFERDIGASGYQIGRVDVDNDGTADSIFYAVRQSASTLLVLDAKKMQVDSARTEVLLAHMSRAAAGWQDVRPPWPNERTQFSLLPVADAYGAAMYVPFTYRGATYIRFWWRVNPELAIEDWSKTRSEHIFRVDGLERTEICEYRTVL